MFDPVTSVLGVFAKWPQAGRVKTRLAAATSPNWAARVAAAFLADTLYRLADFPARRVLAFTPVDRASECKQLSGERFELVPQEDGDLGQRMAGFFAARFREGAERVVLLGTDSPTLPLDYVHRAMEMLADSDVVLGPATDGGYYLVGGTPRMPPIFNGITWGQADVFAETIARIPSTSRLALLAPWYDVDTLNDWNRLRGHVAGLRRERAAILAPRTERLLAMPESSLNWSVGLASLPLAFAHALQWVVDNGFSQVELSLASELCSGQLELLADSGLFVSSAVISPSIQLDDADASQRRAAVAECGRYISAAARTGATVCVIDAPRPSDAASAARLTESCRRLAEHANRQFVRLCVPALNDRDRTEAKLGRSLVVAHSADAGWEHPIDHVALILEETPSHSATVTVRRLRQLSYAGPVVLSTRGDWRLLRQMLARLEKAAFIDLSPE